MIFRYTILYVENIADTLAFYEPALGLERGLLVDSNDYGELGSRLINSYSAQQHAG